MPEKDGRKDTLFHVEHSAAEVAELLALEVLTVLEHAVGGMQQLAQDRDDDLEWLLPVSAELVLEGSEVWLMVRGPTSPSNSTKP